jgi:hypothetical protein
MHRAQSDYMIAQVFASVLRGKHHSSPSGSLNAAAGVHRPAKATVTLKTLPCLREAVAAYESVAGRFSDYALKHVQVLLDICDALTGKGMATDDIAAAVRERECLHCARTDNAVFL